MSSVSAFAMLINQEKGVAQDKLFSPRDPPPSKARSPSLPSLAFLSLCVSFETESSSREVRWLVTQQKDTVPFLESGGGGNSKINKGSGAVRWTKTLAMRSFLRRR